LTSVDLDLPGEVEVILFRALRELLVNVVKHAEASKVRVTVKAPEKDVRIVVEDDGKGFVEEDSKGGFGLFSIRERLTHLGGKMKIDAATGQGARVEMTVPRLGRPEKVEEA
jgi:signal transduction histidine kinase